MRTDELWLRDIRDAALAIDRFLVDTRAEDFAESDLLQTAVVGKLAVIGEAAKRISEELRTSYPSVPWREAIGLRNIIVHAYFSIESELIWSTVQTHVLPLKEQVVSILEKEFNTTDSTN